MRNKVEKKLTKHDFVFSRMQGVAYWYLKLDEGDKDDPPVYFYQEGTRQKKPFMIALSFSNYLKRKYEGDTNLFAPFR